MRASLALIVLILNAAAILSILGSRSVSGRKFVWIAGVVLVPLVGALGWLLVGRTKTRPAAPSTETGWT